MKRMVILGVLVLLASLVGCGGGNSPAFNNMPVSDAARSAAFDAIDAQDATLDGKTEDDRLQALAAFMKKRAEFEDAGVAADGSAWGRFTDGVLAIIARDREPGATRTSKLPASSSRAGRASSGLPASTTIRFFDTMGPVFKHSAQAIQDQLSTRGYNPPQVIAKTGTVEDLKQVQGNGIFYIDAHGGIGYERGAGTGNVEDNRKIFCIWTSTVKSIGLNQQYLSDLQSNRLVFMKGLVDRKDGKRIEEWHYGITPAFVGAYMKFGANSIVYIDACASDNPGFKAACLSAGAGLYLGWNTETNDDYSTPAAQFFFDRMLGTDAVAPIDPANPPPLDWQSVKSAMASTLIPGTQVHYGHSPSVDPSKYPEADLIFTAGQGDLAVIVPSIESVSPDWTTHRVTLTGKFGAKIGTAAKNTTTTTAGSAVGVVSWTGAEVVLELPDDCHSVQLTVDGRAGNIAMVPNGRTTIDPATTSITAAEMAHFTAKTDLTVPAGSGLTYHWSTSGAFGIISDAKNHGGTSFDTTENQIAYTPNPGAQGQDTVMVQITVVMGNQKVGLAPAMATVTVGATEGQVKVKIIDAVNGDSANGSSTDWTYLVPLVERTYAMKYATKAPSSLGTFVNTQFLEGTSYYSSFQWHGHVPSLSAGVSVPVAPPGFVGSLDLYVPYTLNGTNYRFLFTAYEGTITITNYVGNKVFFEATARMARDLENGYSFTPGQYGYIDVTLSGYTTLTDEMKSTKAPNSGKAVTVRDKLPR